MDTSQLTMLLPLWYCVFLLSLTCHEAAHALAARLGGDDTAYLGGQVSLNPVPHVQREPVGALLVPLITFLYYKGGWMMGWASAPYDPYWERRHPRRAAVMAAAGPAANLALFLLAFFVLRAGIGTGAWVEPVDGITIDRIVAPSVEDAGVLEPLGRIFSIMLFLNLVLFLFNLIPFPPLDGASVVGGVFEPARRLLDEARGWGTWVGLAAAWLLFPRIFRPIAVWVIRLLYG